MHSRAQLSTGNRRETSCQEIGVGILSRQIEPGGLKNFAAQLKEGARTVRFMRPRFFCRAVSSIPRPSLGCGRVSFPLGVSCLRLCRDCPHRTLLASRYVSLTLPDGRGAPPKKPVMTKARVRKSRAATQPPPRLPTMIPPCRMFDASSP